MESLAKAGYTLRTIMKKARRLFATDTFSPSRDCASAIRGLILPHLDCYGNLASFKERKLAFLASWYVEKTMILRRDLRKDCDCATCLPLSVLPAPVGST